MRRERRYGVRWSAPSETEVTASWSNRYPVGSVDGHYRSCPEMEKPLISFLREGLDYGENFYKASTWREYGKLAN